MRSAPAVTLARVTALAAVAVFLGACGTSPVEPTAVDAASRARATVTEKPGADELRGVADKQTTQSSGVTQTSIPTLPWY